MNYSNKAYVEHLRRKYPPGTRLQLNCMEDEMAVPPGSMGTVDFIDDGLQGQIKVTLKYAQGKESVIKGLKRISKPGLRVYTRNDEIPKVLGGLGIAILSTPQGVMTDRAARNAGIGGEVLAYIW